MVRNSILLVSLACFAVFMYLLVRVLFVAESEPSKRTEEIHEAFIIAEDYIDAQTKFVSSSEIEQWFLNYKGSNSIVKRLKFERANEDRGLPKLLGEIPPDSYMLAYWRGEWMEVYAPWSGQSTMCSIEKSCNSFKEMWISLMISLILGCYFMWGYKRLGARE